jgi:site-specific recombinase XerD
MRFSELLKEYEQLLIVRNYAKNTIESCKRIIRNLFKYLQGKKIMLNDVTLNEMNHYTEYLIASGKYSHNYIYGQISAIKGFFRFLYSHKYIERDEVSNYAYIKAKKELPKDLPSQEELYTILSEVNLNIMEKTIIELYYATGIRLSELIGLNVGDVDFNNNLLFIKEGKGMNDRIVPLTDHALRLIQDHLKACEKVSLDDPLFLSSIGKRISETVIARIFRKVKEESQTTKKLNAHTLRHCFATHMLENGASVRDIQEILGHEDLGTTQRYTQVEISDLKRVIKRFHPRENEIYSDEQIILPNDQFFTRKKGCKRDRKSH